MGQERVRGHPWNKDRRHPALFDATTAVSEKVVQKKQTCEEAFGSQVMNGVHLHMGNVHPEETQPERLPADVLEELHYRPKRPGEGLFLSFII